MTWYYNDEQFTSNMIDDYVGFVYLIVDNNNGMKYIGKKNFYSTQRLRPLKGKKRRRVVKKESDWMSYHGSSEEVKSLVDQYGSERFTRYIIRLCKTKGEMSYYEAKEQIDRDVLLKPDEYYNSFVGLKVHRKHLKLDD